MLGESRASLFVEQVFLHEGAEMQNYGSFDAMATGTGALTGGGTMSVFNVNSHDAKFAMQGVLNMVKQAMGMDAYDALDYLNSAKDELETAISAVQKEKDAANTEATRQHYAKYDPATFGEA